VEPEIALGIVLKSLRKQRKLSQESLAHEAGIERNYVSLLELGRSSATIKVLFKIAPVLGVTVSELVNQVEILLIANSQTGKSSIN
jgi:transcriptional regulator with XRE-family HTH domain